MGNKRFRVILLIIIITLLLGYLLPERITVPVANATPRDWHPQSFWFEPWGVSGVHKGIDIFGKTGTSVLSTTGGLVLFSGQLAYGGNVVLVLGPKWRLHYFAHLESIKTQPLNPVSSGEVIGALGDSGNAKGKPPHLHYAIIRLLPAFWEMDASTQGYKKAFYINPDPYLKGG
jgi:murein DD-endopeptidase MepM/ murein hydrolase activator NlpD